MLTRVTNKKEKIYNVKYFVEDLDYTKKKKKFTISLSLKMMEHPERKHITLNTSEVIDYVREEYKFIVSMPLIVCTIQNNVEELRHGKWEFIGEFANQEPLGITKEELEETIHDELVTITQEEESKLDKLINSKIGTKSKSLQRRTNIQKKEE